MNNNTLLSICIPTYNGASSYLGVILDILHPILNNNNNNIELIVSDNCSIDGTWDLLESYSKTKNYRYFRNESNLGFNSNMLLLTDSYAIGKYCWLLGDDDLICIDALPTIISILEKEEVDFISLGYNRIEKTNILKYREKIQYHVKYGKYANAIDSNCINGNAFATFISASIFLTEKFREVPKDFLSTAFVKYYDIFPNAYILSTAFHSSPCAYILEPVVLPINRYKPWSNSDNLYHITSVVLFDFFKYLISLGIDKKDLKNTWERVLFLNVFNGIARLWHKGKISSIFLKCLLLSIAHPRVYFRLISYFWKAIVKLIRQTMLKKIG